MGLSFVIGACGVMIIAIVAAWVWGGQDAAKTAFGGAVVGGIAGATILNPTPAHSSLPIDVPAAFAIATVACIVMAVFGSTGTNGETSATTTDDEGPSPNGAPPVPPDQLQLLQPDEPTHARTPRAADDGGPSTTDGFEGWSAQRPPR